MVRSSHIARRVRGATTRVGVLAIAAALLFGSLVLAEGEETTTPGRSLPTVGAQFHGLWSDYDDAQRAQVLDTLVESGVQWVRIDVSWAMLQPDAPDLYSDWGVEFVDRVIGMAHDRGLRVLVMFWLTPGWANGAVGERAGPSDPQDYAAALAWLAERHAGRVDAWQVWNEPNDPRFFAGASPADYTQLLRAAYGAVRQADPETLVVFGGTSYNDAEWISEAYDAGAAGHFDVMATHPYQGVADLPPETPDDGTRWLLTHVSEVREVMVRNGDQDKSIWFTELGWSSHTSDPDAPNWARGVTREQQADYLVRTLNMLRARYPYVSHVFWYRERDVDRGHPHKDNYGLLDRELRAKPVLQRLRAELTNGGPP